MLCGFNKNCQHFTYTCPIPYLPIKGTDVLNLIYSGTSNLMIDDESYFLQEHCLGLLL